MATKKPNTLKQKPPIRTQTPKPPSVSVRIDRLADYEDSNIKAFASANIGGAFAIHGIKVVDSENGLFVSMPNNSYTDSDGNKKYSDIFHPVTAEARKDFYAKVLDAYEQKLAEEQSEDETEDESEGLTPSM